MKRFGFAFVLVACASTPSQDLEPCPRYVTVPEVVDPYAEPSSARAGEIEVIEVEPEPVVTDGGDADPFARVF